jgi:hypothetical protein
MKKLALYWIFLVLIFRCDDSENTYSPEPQIETGEIKFIEGHIHIRYNRNTVHV